MDGDGPNMRRSPGPGNRVLRKPSPIVLVAVLSLATLACNRESAGSGRQDNAIQDGEVAASDQNAALADDPLFSANEIVVHEYGDEQRVAPAPAQAVAAPNQLRGAAIRKAVAGHELTDGVHWSWAFKPAGKLLSEENGRRTTGRWRIDGDELCIDAGYGDRCHTVTRQGRSLQLWHDGTVAVEADLK